MPIDTPSPRQDLRSAGQTVNPERWVEDYGDYLYSYALLRIRDPEGARDAVQETFMAALKNLNAYAGRSSEKAWLTGILKNKVYDCYRTSARAIACADVETGLPEELNQFATDGFGKGAWGAETSPREWSTVDDDVSRTEFWSVMHTCLGKLPRNIGRAFLLRELDGLTTPEICSVLSITESNLWVALHRARLALRLCLQRNWYE